MAEKEKKDMLSGTIFLGSGVKPVDTLLHEISVRQVEIMNLLSNSKAKAEPGTIEAKRYNELEKNVLDLFKEERESMEIRVDEIRNYWKDTSSLNERVVKVERDQNWLYIIISILGVLIVGILLSKIFLP